MPNHGSLPLPSVVSFVVIPDFHFVLVNQMLKQHANKEYSLWAQLIFREFPFSLFSYKLMQPRDP